MTVLAAGDGLAAHIDAAGACRIAWGETDWFGPGTLAVAGVAASGRGAGEVGAGRDDLGRYRAVELGWVNLPVPVRTTLRAYADRPLLVFELSAPQALTGIASGRFALPAAAWPHFAPRSRHAGGVAEGTTSYAHQWSEFALPLFGDADGGGFVLAPHRPPVVQPLMMIAPDGRTVMLAPLDHFHEQIVAVPADRESIADGLRCGWHGDLEAVPAGFATELGVWAAASPRAALEAWIGCLRSRHAVSRPSRYADAGLARLSYWTDNGAHYYYRTAEGADYLATLERAVADCEARGIPIGMVQIDSWFYPHEHPRPVGAEGAPIVPPSGMLRWEPREDLFPDGFADLRRRLGGRPLAFHSRHFSARSPYFAADATVPQPHAAFIDGDYAHPRDPALFDRLLGSAATWGAVTYEQDWMVESYFGVRALRAAPGRARAWQEALDGAATAHGLTLQWCMATPADFLQTLTLRRLTSIRTSGDYRYLFDNGLNWVWFLHTNALARALGLNAFKDVFISERAAEPYAEIEALLAALSTGPVGIGDRIGGADRELVMRTCREDGILVKPDAPLAAVDACFRQHGYLAERLLIGETFSRHPAGRWSYVVALHASRNRQPIAQRVSLAELGAERPAGAVLAYDWRRGSWSRLEPDGGWEVELPWQDWDFRVLCPLLAGDRTVFGDLGRYASVGDRRVADIRADASSLAFEVCGAPHTTVEVHGYTASAPRTVIAASFAGRRELAQAREPDDSWTWQPDGRWIVRVALGRHESARVRMQW